MPTRDHPNERQGAFAEEFVANTYGLEHVPNEAEWYDCVHPERGTKYEVKSTHVALDDGSTGRFRLWRDQHRSLTASQGAPNQTAWYAFVLLDEDGDVVDVRRMHPTTVTSIVRDEDGGWNRSGHLLRRSRQHKIPWPQILDE